MINYSEVYIERDGKLTCVETGFSSDQADQLRSARFLKAEKLAMEAPVKLLGPLIMFIFPNTFLVIGFVILSKALSEDVITWEPLVWVFTHPG